MTRSNKRKSRENRGPDSAPDPAAPPAELADARPDDEEEAGASGEIPEELEAGDAVDPGGAELEEELVRLRSEATDAADRALRTLAEFDNYRRRTERELDAARDRGAAEVLHELLEVADNFDRALGHAGPDVPESFLEGMQLVARGIHDLLDRRGVSRIEAVGTPFDPELHDALTRTPTEDADPNTVVQEIQPGYRLGDRVLRPAKVIVAAAVEAGRDS